MHFARDGSSRNANDSGTIFVGIDVTGITITLTISNKTFLLFILYEIKMKINNFLCNWLLSEKTVKLCGAVAAW